MSRCVQLVQGQLDAYNDFDLKKFCSFFHPDVVIKNLLEKKIIATGMSQFESLFSDLFKKYPNQKCLIKTRIIKGASVIDEELILGRPEYPDGYHVVVIYTFRDDLISEVWLI